MTQVLLVSKPRKTFDVGLVEDRLNTLDQADVVALANILHRLDPCAVDENTGKPHFTSEEMDVINQFRDLDGDEVVAGENDADSIRQEDGVEVETLVESEDGVEVEII